MKLDFYYFSFQCPLNSDMLQLLEDYNARMDICAHDISQDPALAKEMGMFYPTLTVLNGHARYYGPLTKPFLEQAANDEYPVERPYLPVLSQRRVTRCLEPLGSHNLSIACRCTGRDTESGCAQKARFLRSCGQGPYGVLHRNERGNLVGGAEYLPSMLVPYDIPCSEETAFITCVYLSDAEWDYKTAPLKALERYLGHAYTTVLAISDEKGVFPNGDLRFFLRNGYSDQGVVFQDPNYCSLHLVSKKLPPAGERS